MAVSFSAGLIDVTSGSETMASLYANVGNTGTPKYIELSGSTYTIKSATQLEISAGATLSIAQNETVIFQPAADNFIVPECLQNGTLNVADGVTIQATSNRTYEPYIRIYGNSNLSGTSGNHITIKDYKEMRVYSGYDYATTHTWTYVDLTDLTTNGTNGGYYFYYGGYSATDYDAADSFSYITIGSTSYPDLGYGLFTFAGDYSNTTFDHWTVDDVENVLYLQGTNIRFTNSTFKNSVNAYPVARYGGSQQRHTWNHSKTPSWGLNTPPYQHKCIFDTCVFDNNYTASTTHAFMEVSNGARVYFKDCTFQNAAYGIYAFRDGVAVTNNCTFTNIATADRRWAALGAHLHGFELALTVEDTAGSPLQGASVQVIQSSSPAKEYWEFTTDSNGQIKDCHGQNPVFIHREETSTGVYDNWSTSISSGLFHWIVVSKPGFQVWKRKVEFTADRTITAKLVAEGGPRTVYQD
jgi:hypothetical protein